MDNQRSSLFAWAYDCHGKGVEELRHYLLCTTLELESTKMAVQEELRRRDEQLIHLRDLLNRAVRERDEAQEKCHKVLIEKFLIQQNQQTLPLSGISSIEDEPRRGVDSNNGFSSSDCEESIVSSPVLDPVPQPKAPPPPPPPQTHGSAADDPPELVPEKPLPEKGKLLQAVMKAGPLLQTLLLAGPLPQWRHPPPPIDTLEIPPVTIPSPPHSGLLLHHHHHQQDANLVNLNCGSLNRKRAFCEGGSEPSPEAKFQRVLPH